MKALLIASFFFMAHISFGGNPTIKSIRFQAEPDSYNIYIDGDGKLLYRSSLLADPPRIVLDFASVRNKLSLKNLEPKQNPYVMRIRCSAKNGTGPFRIVVDLKTVLDYSVSPVSEGILLRLAARTKIHSVTANVPAQPANTELVRRNSRIDIDIGAEDLLEVTVFELPQFNVTSRVAADGTITMPLIGSVEVRGLTKKEAERKIASALDSEYINNASVSVNIKEYKSKQVSVLGAVNNPGSYYILSNRSLLQVLSDAGGLAPTSGRKCFIFRSGSSKIEIDLHELMTSGNEDLNVPVLPGDVIHFPPDSKVVVYVLGAVGTPGEIQMVTSLPVTLLAAIAKAGGLKRDANRSNIQIRRKDVTGAEIVLKANLKEILSGKRADISLISGDVINIPESFF